MPSVDELQVVFALPDLPQQHLYVFVHLDQFSARAVAGCGRCTMIADPIPFKINLVVDKLHGSGRRNTLGHRICADDST